MIRDFVQNDMFVGVMGIKEFIEFQKGISLEERKEIVLISITEPDNTQYVSDDPTTTIGFHDVLESKFWDVEERIGNYNCLSDEQGTEIQEFILRNKDKRFLIHCKAGMSRSAGVAKAVECLINFDGDKYSYLTSQSALSGYERYCPNLTVFDKVVQ